MMSYLFNPICKFVMTGCLLLLYIQCGVRNQDAPGSEEESGVVVDISQVKPGQKEDEKIRQAVIAKPSASKVMYEGPSQHQPTKASGMPPLIGGVM